MRRLVATGAAFALAVLCVAGCDTSDKGVSDSPCLDVGSALLGALGIDAAAATKATYEPTPTGLKSNGGRVWFVSTASGATWVTNIDPGGSAASGLILPLNVQALEVRRQSAPLDTRAPAYAGVTDAVRAAKQSRECASS